ncbi:MAG: hypothetical protein OJF52_000701 [Nitrospira sp.]|jgi:hypothetical protein|nr:MAG: hypothetical protein OJF52_000701 [Nitrospira sp.]
MHLPNGCDPPGGRRALFEVPFERCLERNELRSRAVRLSATEPEC